MLSTTDNQILTRVSAGTVMGDLMRRYWIPAVFSSEIAKDGVPHRTRLLGEDLLVLRLTSGKVATMSPSCPHRGASLFFGRNEEEGLRCVYHGWKFDELGQCIDMPSEPPESNFKGKVSHVAYRTIERNGLIWIYMGPEQDNPPSHPDLEWNLVPENQCFMTKRIAQNNYFQTLEGEIDSSHSGFLHSSFTDPFRLTTKQEQGMIYKMRDRHPRFEALDTDYGVLIGARRNAEVDSYYWRITQFLFPFHTIIPPYGNDPLFSGHAWVPMDDENVIALCFTYNPVRPLTESELDYLHHGRHDGLQTLHPTVDAFLPEIPNRPEGAWWPKHHIDNAFDINWDLQKTTFYTGLPGTWVQDSGMQETMGRVVNRANEHLGVSDTAIIRARRALLKASKLLNEQGIEPTSVNDPTVYNIRSAAVVIPKDVDWVTASEKYRSANPTKNFAAI